MISVFFRHGARTSIHSSQFETDDYIKRIGKGNLTPNGMRMHYMLGQQLKTALYPSLFKGVYNQSSIEVHSTDVDRTLMSANSQLQGLFPVGTGYDVTCNGSYLKPPNLNYSLSNPPTPKAIPPGILTFPIHTTSRATNTLFMPNFKKICPTAYAYHRAEAKKRFTKYGPLLEKAKANLKT